MSQAVAVFRPDDERASEAEMLLSELGVEPLLDPMLAIEPTGASARPDAEYTILTSKTGAELVAAADTDPGGELVATAFFATVLMAAVTSGISLLETPVDHAAPFQSTTTTATATARRRGTLPCSAALACSSATRPPPRSSASLRSQRHRRCSASASAFATAPASQPLDHPRAEARGPLRG